ncbi:MAG: iron ABC transporter permease [Treponema sp.]|nr:iron ABC transporter permease [Treponema sp.]
MFLGLIVIYPSLTLVINSFKTEAGYSLANYAMIFKDQGIIQSMINSAKVVLPTTVFATIMGVFLAWAAARTDVPCKRAWQILLSIPYFIPPFIGAISWTFLLGPVGYFNRFFMTVFGLETPLLNIYSIPGMVFVMSIYRYAVPFIVVLPTMRKIPASMEEASRISGASPWKTMRNITLPLLAPSIIGAMLLLFMFVLADFGVSAALGAPNRIRLMTTQIYYLIHRPDMPNNMQIAAAYSIFLSLFGLLGLWLYNRVLKTNKFSVVTGKSAAAEPVKLGFARWMLFGALALVFLISTCAPIIAALITSLTKVYGLPFGPGNMTVKNITGLVLIPNIARSFQNSLVLSAVSAVIIAVVTLIIAYIAIRGGVRGVRGIGLMQTMVTLPYALPGTIIAIAMILSFAQPLPVTGWKIYGTIWILLVAYIARFMNLGYSNIAGAISQIDISLEEAARVSGASHTRAFGDIVLPLLKNSMISSFFLVAAPALSEITLSALLWSVGSETIGTVVFNSQEEGKILRTAALAIMLIILVVFVNILIQNISERAKKRNGKNGGAVALTPQ